MNRFEFLESEPQRLVAAEEPLPPPPSALEPIPADLSGVDRGDFGWIVRQLQNLDAATGGGGSGVPLDNLSDVAISSPQPGQGLFRNEANTLFVNSVVPAPLTLTVVDTLTTGPVTALTLRHDLSSGIAATGHGVGLELWSENAAGTSVAGGGIRTETSDPTAGAENIGLVFLNRVSGTYGEAGRFSGSTGHLNIANAVQATGGLMAGAQIGKDALVHIARSGVSNPAAAVRRSLFLQAPSDTDIPAGEEIQDVFINLGAKTWLTGGIAQQRGIRIAPQTMNFAGASTVTKAATVAISGAPAAGTNATLTDRYALWVESGKCLFTGDEAGVVFEIPQVTAAAPTGLSRKYKVYVPGVGVMWAPLYDS